MKNNYFRFRIFLFMFALGLAAVPFSNNLYEKLSDVSVDLPQTSSNSPLIIDSYYRTEVDNAVGSGPDGKGNTEVINTLGSQSKLYTIEKSNYKKQC